MKVNLGRKRLCCKKAGAKKKRKEKSRVKEGAKEEGEWQRLSVGDPGMLILFVCLPPMIKLF